LESPPVAEQYTTGFTRNPTLTAELMANECERLTEPLVIVHVNVPPGFIVR
jgi:hypothetical protein